MLTDIWRLHRCDMPCWFSGLTTDLQLLPFSTQSLGGLWFNSLRPRQNGRHFTDDTFKRFFQYENIWISIKTSLMFVPKGPINNIPALVQIMAWRRPGDKPLSEPMVVSLPTHICVTRPQWVNTYILRPEKNGWHFCRRYFEMQFLEWKSLYLDEYGT